jgi:predicted aconitase
MRNLPRFSLSLSQEEEDLLLGRKGKTLQKVMKTVALYGEACGADRLIPIQGAPHFALPVSMPGIGLRLEMMDELIESGLRTQEKFTVDPRPVDVERMELTPSQAAYFHEVYGKQDQYEKKLKILGLRDDKAFTCTCYLPEVGNTPGYGDVVAWSESSAVIFANSVLGARTNRNGAVMDLLCNIIGKTPHFGLLTDEGRQAKWLFVVRTSNLPDPQLLGGAIGRYVGEDVVSCGEYHPRGQDEKEEPIAGWLSNSDH